MNRFGIFVDAGYLFSAAGSLLFGTTDRRKVTLDPQAMVTALVALAAENCGREHLRTYWYDGARDLVPTAQQREIANLPSVKLRLGRLTAHGQKGVDSRIVRDLIILSIERAITDAFLLGGDEDLREGVSEAQERGVRVALVGIEPLNEQNLSPALAMEADRVLVLDRAFVAPHLRLREPDVSLKAAPEDEKDPTALGRSYALRYFEEQGGSGLGQPTAVPGHSIPPEIDRQLLGYASRALGASSLDHGFKSELRASFCATIAELYGLTAEGHER